ncbi:hypothetical protein [Streptomyces sp. NPDC040750]|uniref:hypothetical protein n=1 Tax=Streptomyces sp. NPDC040750 TaxID=3154491 RepID=UPI0033E766C8
MTLRLIRTLAAAVLVLVCAGTPAHADAHITDGKVGISVKGHGLRVKRATGWMDGHATGARARLHTVYKGTSTNLTHWRDATPRTVGVARFSDVNWNLNGTVENGTWLCIESTAPPARP